MIAAQVLPTPGVTVRNAVAGDLPACAAILNDYIDEMPWLPRIHAHDEIAAMFPPELLATRTILLAETSAGIAGYLSLKDDFVRAVSLAPAARGAGIGGALLEQAKALRPAGLSLTFYEPNTRALAFYASHGFAEVAGGRDTETQEGVPTLFLCWPGERI